MKVKFDKILNTLRESDEGSGGGGGIVSSIIAGTGIAIDNTDPANPVVSSTITQISKASQVTVNAGLDDTEYITSSTFTSSEQLADKASLTGNNIFTGLNEFQNDTTFSANVSFDSQGYFRSTGLRIYNPAGTFFYTFNAGAILGNRNMSLPVLTGSDTFVFQDFTQTLTNKTLTDSTTFFQDNSDNTKKIQFELSGISTGTTRTITMPDANITPLGRTGTNASGQMAFFNDANQVTSNSTITANASGIGIGVAATSTNVLNLLTAQNAAMTLNVKNNTSNTAAQARIIAENSGGDVAQFGVFSAAFTPVGSIASRSAYFYGSNALVLWSGTNLIFASGGSATERGRFATGGEMSLGVAGTNQATGSGALNMWTSNASSNTSFYSKNTVSTGQFAWYFEGDRTAFASYGGFLYGGSAMASAGFFGAATRADRLFLFADGASNLGFYTGTLNAQPYVIGTNNVARVTVLSNGNVGISQATPTSALHTTSFATAYVAKTADYTLTASDYTVDFTANNCIATLESAVGCAGRIHNIKNSGTGVITLATTSSQTIDGNASGTLSLIQYENLTVQSNGTNWIIL